MRNRRHSYGFTLPEVMVVMVLVGIIATLAVATLPDSVNVRQEEERMLSSLRWGTEQAMLEGTIYAVQLDRYGWTLVRLSHTPNSRGQSLNWPGYFWRPVAFGHHAFPDGITLELMIEGQRQPLPATEAEAADSEPQIFLLPGGEVTPFSIRLRANKQTGRQIAWHEGQIRLMEAP